MQKGSPHFSLFLVLILVLTLSSFTVVSAKEINNIDKVEYTKNYKNFIKSDVLFDSITVEKSRGHIKTNFSDNVHNKKRKIKYSISGLRDQGVIYPSVYVNGSEYTDWTHDLEWLTIDFVCCSDVIVEINNTGFISIVEIFSTSGIQGDNQAAINNFNLQTDKGNFTIYGKDNFGGEELTNLSDVLLYLNFNEGSGEVGADSSGNVFNFNVSNTTWGTGLYGTNGIGTNGTPQSRACYMNCSTSMTNDSLLQLNDTDFTIEIHFKPTVQQSQTATPDGGLIDHYKASTNQGWYLEYETDTGGGLIKPEFAVGNGTDSEIMVPTGFDFPIGYSDWINMTVSYGFLNASWGRMRIYINGSLVAERNTTINVSTGYVDAVTIGGAAPLQTGTEYLNGSIDEVIIWTRELTPNEVYKRQYRPTRNVTVNSSGGDFAYNGADLWGIDEDSFVFNQSGTDIKSVLNNTWNISSDGSDLVNWSYSNRYNLSFIEVTRWDDTDGDGRIDDIEYTYTVCENSSPCTINGSVTHNIRNSSLEGGLWRVFSDGNRIGTASASNGLMVIVNPPVNSVIRVTNPHEILWEITEFIQELPALFGAIADTIPAIVRMLIMLAIGIFILGILAIILLTIGQSFQNQELTP